MLALPYHPVPCAETAYGAPDPLRQFKEQLLEQLLLAGQRHGFVASDIVMADGSRLPVSNDSKVLSALFEQMCAPALRKVAADNGMALIPARKQNHYPDFTVCEHDACRQKVAVDIKSAYDRAGEPCIFTLSAYRGFIQLDKETKNITFPFSQYAHHLIVGLIYERQEPGVDQAGNPLPSYGNVRCFIQEKWRIASDKPGSGNTTNIGSQRLTLEGFRNPTPVFRDEAEFLAYWRDYGKPDAGYTDIASFRALRVRQGNDLAP